ncbi:MAG: hypothetical protein OHK0039_12220 [Bacteroidia bacterium]
MHFARLLSVLLLTVGLSYALQAQVCTPDTAYTAPGVYPLSLPEACAGAFYDMTITVVVPPDTTAFGISATIDSVVLSAVNGIPAGVSYSCVTPNCRFLGGTSGCVRVSGIPTTPGSYSIDLVTTYYASTFIGPVVLPNTATGYYTLVVNPGVDATVNITPASCGGADGSASLSILGGTPPFSYLWSNGDTASATAGLASGAYSVAVSDSNGCAATFNFTIPSSGANPSIDTLATNWSGCAEDAGGQIAATVSGGTQPYAYNWSSGDTTATVDGLAAGSYILSITDGLGCTAVDTVALIAPPVLTFASVDAQDLDCYADGSGAIAVQMQGGAGSLAYSWTPDLGTSSMVDGLAAGTYTVQVVDSLGCAKDSSFTLSQPDSLGVVFVVANTSSSTSEIIAQPFGGTGSYIFAWSNGSDEDTLTDLAPGVYVLTLTDANGCVLTDSAKALLIGNIGGVSGLLEAHAYPNPTRDLLHVELLLAQAQPLSLSLISLQGQEIGRAVFATHTQFRHTVSLQSQPTGIYLLVAQTATGVWTQRIVKE